MVGLRTVPLVLLLAHAVYGASIDVEILADRATENRAVEGIIKVRHAEDELVHPETFTYHTAPLDVEFMHESLQSSVAIVNGRRQEERMVTSQYRFFIPARAAGHYQFDSIQVIVGQEILSSDPITYTVFASSQDARFRIESEVRGGSVIYPGQRMELVYRITCSVPIDITAQDLPFMTPKGFKKTKERKVSQKTVGRSIVHEMVQEVEAVAPGMYEFGEASVEGLAYKQDFFGRRSYEKNPLIATAPPAVLEVAAFPTPQPSSFSGAIGRYSITAKLTSNPEIMVGDRMQLDVAVEGDGVVSTLSPPSLLAQGDFSKSFRISDMPPEVRSTKKGKIFQMEVRPMQSVITEIPPISFTSFDPALGEYVETKTDPIPVSIIAPVAVQPPPTFEQVVAASGVRQNSCGGCLPVTAQDLDNERPKVWMLALIPFFIAVLVLQKGWLGREKKVKAATPLDLFASGSAALARGDTIGIRLLEEGLSAQLKFRPDDTSIKPIIDELHRLRFSGNIPVVNGDLITHIQEILS